MADHIVDRSPQWTIGDQVGQPAESSNELDFTDRRTNARRPLHRPAAAAQPVQTPWRRYRAAAAPAVRELGPIGSYNVRVCSDGNHLGPTDPAESGPNNSYLMFNSSY